MFNSCTSCCLARQPAAKATGRQTPKGRPRQDLTLQRCVGVLLSPNVYGIVQTVYQQLAHRCRPCAPFPGLSPSPLLPPLPGPPLCDLDATERSRARPAISCKRWSTAAPRALGGRCDLNTEWLFRRQRTAFVRQGRAAMGKEDGVEAVGDVRSRNFVYDAIQFPICIYYIPQYDAFPSIQWKCY